MAVKEGWTLGSARSRNQTGEFQLKEARTMFRQTIGSLILLSSLFACTMPGTTPSNGHIIIKNASTQSISNVYFTPAGTAYGTNRLSLGELISPGGNQSWVAAPGIYDVEASTATNADGYAGVWEWKSQSLASGETLTFTCNAGSIETVIVATQSGSITSGIAGNATFAVTTTNVSDGTVGAVSWYSSGAGTIATTTPIGILTSVSAINSNAAIITMTAGTNAVAGSYYFTLTEESGISSIATLNIAPSAIGTIGPGGGIIFYDKGSYSNGWRYLEAAPSDQSTGIAWYIGSYITISTGTAIGTGKANTSAIIASQGAGNYAASLCNSLTIGGYSDWFLPSEDELSLMYQNLQLAGLGGFSMGEYYSSSQYNISPDCDWVVYFSSGVQDGAEGSYLRAVRACRQY
jgi:hypothetical protein